MDDYHNHLSDHDGADLLRARVAAIKVALLRGSTMHFDNLSIRIDITACYTAYAQRIGKSNHWLLTDAERRAAILDS